MSLYDSVRANVDTSAQEERVEVNQRALIDKILARYASAGAVYRELLQNSNDAEATTAEIHFTTTVDSPNNVSKTNIAISRQPIVTTVEYRNNGLPFRPQDWARLKKIAEGNPDESKIGAFGVGAYTMFSICEEPIVLSGTQALAFIWKGDALWTKTIDNDNGAKNKGWTCFILPSRDPYPLPDMQEFGEFLCAALTFTKALKEIRVYVDKKCRMTITKTQIQEPTVVQIQKNSSWWKSDGATTVSPNGLFSLRDENSLLESLYHVQVTLDGETAAVTARYLSAAAKTKIPTSMTKRMERVTKKKPPSKVDVQIFLNGQQEIADEIPRGRKSKAHKIVQSFSPRIGEGRIFIGFRTSQTTGLAAHLAAPFVPTVEREAMDLQDQTLRIFNLELLEFSGILMRLTLEHGMSSLGVEFSKGADERAKLEELLLKEEEERRKNKAAVKPPAAASLGETTNGSTLTPLDETEQVEADEPNEKKSRMWGFAKYMAKGVKKTIVKVVNKVEEFVDDGGELIHPSDPRPLCSEEHQAIILMQSFCPRQSTPDPTVGMALAQGFSRCLPEKAPPVLTRTGVVAGDEARLPNKGMEAFCTENVVRSIVLSNAEEYHKVIAQCQPLNIQDLLHQLERKVFEEDQLIRFLKWWVKFTKIHTSLSSSTSLDIKDRIQFYMDYKEKNDAIPIFRLRDFLFFLDKDTMRTTAGFSIDALPMPETLLPKTIQEQVTLRSLTDSALSLWFDALPIELWIDFISNHDSMNLGQPEDEKLRIQVLSTISQEFMKRSDRDQISFGNFCQSVLQERRCIPFDSSIPTSYSAESPSNLYLYSAELDAFDGIGSFHKVSQSLKHMGVTDEFLVSLGVRKSVAIDFLFANLRTLKWNSDPKPLIEYLRKATLTDKDFTKLKSSQYLPSESEVHHMFAPHELYLPDRELRIFPFLQLLQWPSEDEITERSENGRFLVSLGMKVEPDLVHVLRYVTNQVSEDVVRVKCLEYVTKRLGSGGSYSKQYSRIGRSERLKLKFLPCVIKNPLGEEEKHELYSVLTCCSEERCAVMGFPVIDPALGNMGKIAANLFQCAKEPDPNALIQQLISIVSSAKDLIRKTESLEREHIRNRVIQNFPNIFQYLSTRLTEISPAMMNKLVNHQFIPCLVGIELQWFRPNEVFFKTEDETDSLTNSLFHVVAFNSFLAASGVKQEASTKDIFRLLIRTPQTVLSTVKTEEKYRGFLRRVAAYRPFTRVTDEIRNSPFLLAYSVSQDETSMKSQYGLDLAENIYIIDNSFFGRMFPVKRAPPESDLEEFYALIGSKYISKEVDKKFDVVGARQTKTDKTRSLLNRIHERSPLLVSPSVTSRPLVKNATALLDEKHLQIFEAEEIKAVYSLGKSVRSQQTTCCSQPGPSKMNALFVTADFDWFDVGYAIGELILQRCQLEDAFFISSLLEAPLEQLRARGFPVDRIIKTEPLPVPEPVKSFSKREGEDRSTEEFSSSLHTSYNGDEDDQKLHLDDTKKSPTDAHSSASKEDYARVLEQMFPLADEEYIRSRLGQNPSIDVVQKLAEEMTMGNFPEKEKNSSGGNESNKPNKMFGSRKLGKALKGLRPTNFGSGASAGDTQAVDSTTVPSSGRNSTNNLVPPEVDALGHQNMEKILENTVKKSQNVDSSGVKAPEVNIAVPQGLDKGPTCEVIPGQDLKPFVGIKESGEAHNGIKVFSSRKYPQSYQFLLDHVDAIESFAVVIERLSRVFELKLGTVAIFHDPTGGVIAFNLNRALHFNLRFFYSLHYSTNKHSSQACYSYWFVTFCHELAHHMASGHNKEHGFYTESYVSLYLPKLTLLMSQLDH